MEYKNEKKEVEGPAALRPSNQGNYVSSLSLFVFLLCEKKRGCDVSDPTSNLRKKNMRRGGRKWENQLKLTLLLAALGTLLSPPPLFFIARPIEFPLQQSAVFTVLFCSLRRKFRLR